jgi:hypothetical protein
MPDIKDTVGHGRANQPHDVAMVQAMLRMVKNAKGHPYIHSYDGAFGPQTKTAIISFQKDQKIGATSPAPGEEDWGVVAAGGATIQILNASLPDAFKDIRIIEGTKTVYWPGASDEAKKHQAAINIDVQLAPDFRAKVAKLVELMDSRHRIVLSLTNTGGRRTFQEQFKLFTQPNPPTKAGPGESNHNYGMAVDIGFKDFKWMKSDGKAEVDDWWLNRLTKASPAKANEMWGARNDIAFKELLLNPSALKGDLIHVQKHSDIKVSMRRSLADLMQRVGKMTWKHAGAQYQTDFGLGGGLFPVGAAAQIWNKNAQVSKIELAKALSDAQNKHIPPGAITGEQLKNIKLDLLGEMETAETNAFKWEPKP